MKPTPNRPAFILLKNRPDPSVSKSRKIILFIATIIGGFILFVLPNLFFGITKLNGGFNGDQSLFYWSVPVFDRDSTHWVFPQKKRMEMEIHRTYKASDQPYDVWPSWRIRLALIHFLWLKPATGGAERSDIIQMTGMKDDSLITLLSYLFLGIVGGGITEELYNRGYFIRGIEYLFTNKKSGLLIASLSSVLFLVLGHLPHDLISWIDILIPTIVYTILFAGTGSLTPSIVAHSVYNGAAILLVYSQYYLA